MEADLHVDSFEMKDGIPAAERGSAQFCASMPLFSF
jgi:hypothetical protein